MTEYNKDDSKRLKILLKGLNASSFDISQKVKHWSKTNFNEEIAGVKLDELKWRVNARKKYGLALMLLLFVQNLFICGLVGCAYVRGDLQNLSLILGVLVTGTLGETAFIVRIIITELFKDINYKDYNHKSN